LFIQIEIKKNRFYFQVLKPVTIFVKKKVKKKIIFA